MPISIQLYTERFKQWAEPMLHYWQQRSSREQKLLAFTAVFLLAIVIYGLWKPLRDRVNTLRYEVAKQEQIANLLKKIPVTDLEHYLKTPHSDNKVTAINQSLQTTTLNEIANPLQLSNRQLTVSFNEIGFDELIDWLQQLWQQQNIEPVNLKIQRLEKSGAVSAIVSFGV